MSKSIDYYFSPISPFAYLGGERLAKIAHNVSANVNVRPIDFTKVFPATGGIPLKQRAPARLTYRLAELLRWRDYLDVPLALEPKHFPTDANPAALIIVTAREQGLDALALSQRVLRAVWVDERNIADRDILVALAAEVGLNGKALLERSADPEIAAQYERDTQDAIRRGVFGSPTYVIDDELFWGQDRLDFVERKLKR
jgi:2-hydroxychromene-2-carboxylate isomerase